MKGRQIDSPDFFLFPGGEMSSFATRIRNSKAVKGTVIAALATAAIGLTAPTSSASYESTWQEGCRGYWYSTSGHGYCQNATGYPSYGYFATYDCNVEIDTQRYKKLSAGYVGKFDSHECTFKINKTRVYQ